MSKRRTPWWDQKIRVTPRDWMEGLGCLLDGRSWDGPWSRAARQWENEVRVDAAAVQSEMETLGQPVSLELCRNAVVDGWSSELLALARERALRASASGDEG